MTFSRARKNVAVLGLCQALLNSTQSMLIAIGGLVGFALADNKALATLPVSTVVLGTALATVPASLLMGRLGRRPGFMIGAAIGGSGAFVATYAVYIQNFWLVCLGTMLLGIFSAFGQYYRFAAADVAGEKFRSKAISLVLAGGVVAGFAGPELAKWSKDVFAPATFMGTYATVIGLCSIAFLLLILVDIPKPTKYEGQDAVRPLSGIMAQPRFIVAVLNGMIGYGVMSLVMTATPLAMKECAYPFDDAATVIQWHVVGMFGPSFITGSLINRFGVVNIMLAGALLMGGCLSLTLSGIDFVNFWLGLVLLGVGWNFMFVGGTTLLTETHHVGEKAKTQGVNDFLVFATVATASLFSGQLLHWFGWQMVNYVAIPFLVVAAMASLWLKFVERTERLPA
jgi:predicted MFS family arabinose efflux permease